MPHVIAFTRSLAIFAIVTWLAACGGSSGGGNGNTSTGADQQALIAEIANRFPFVPDQPLEQVFVCSITGSILTWYLDFFGNGAFNLSVTLDTGDNLFRGGGTYTHRNGVLSVTMMNDVVFLDETSNALDINMGMVTAFTTDVLDCETIGHRYNAVEFASVVHYQCPISNIQAVSDDENAVELVHSEVPGGFPVPGSAFRQRDRNISGSINPLIRRGYGIYRRAGDRMYAYFARNQFDDYDYLSGNFGNSNNTLTLDQTVVAGSACNRR